MNRHTDDRSAHADEIDPGLALVGRHQTELEPMATRPANGATVRLAALVVVAVILVIAAWLTRRAPDGDEGTGAASTQFVVNDDDTNRSVAERLVSEGVVTDGESMAMLLGDRGGPPEPGSYALRLGAEAPDVASLLIPAPDYWLTFPEGLTVAQMAGRVSEARPRISEQQFIDASSQLELPAWVEQPAGINSAEGLLFPNTYEIRPGDSAHDVVSRMRDLTADVAKSTGLVEGAAALGLSPYELVVVASLIEEEAAVDADRSLIARVIYNRLELDMPLQIDATLLYGQDRNRPFSELREIDTPYNTYLHRGLPPTPISNPGEASLRAALSPAADPEPSDPRCVDLDPGDCRLLFYVLADTDGTHVFAVTYEQHLANIEQARSDGVL